MDASNYPERLIGRSVVPMFRAPDPLSEQVSQALLGMRVLEAGGRGAWRLIITPDGYEGWIAAAAMTEIPAEWGSPWVEIEEMWANLRAGHDYRLAAVIQATVGSRLPLVGEAEGWVELLIPDGRRLWTEAQRVCRGEPGSFRPAVPRLVCRTARRFLGIPYLWGGASPLGLDCSGFVQLVMRLHGVELLRDARQQAGQGRPLAEPDSGDLVFFGPEHAAERITHVGLMLNRERFIHAAGSDRVRINRLADEPYCRQLRGARRVL